MRGRFFALAPAVCVAVTGYVLWTLRDDEAAGRAPVRKKTPADVPIAEPAPPAPAASEPVGESAPATVVAQALPPVPVEEATRLPPTAVEPPPPGLLVGVVRFADGRAPTDVLVIVTRKVTAEEGYEFRTTADGQVRFDRLAPGDYRLRATHPDYAPVSFAFEVAEGAGAGPFDITSTSRSGSASWRPTVRTRARS